MPRFCQTFANETGCQLATDRVWVKLPKMMGSNTNKCHDLVPFVERFMAVINGQMQGLAQKKYQVLAL